MAAVADIPSALAHRQASYGWNQNEMATALGMRPSHYSEVLAGKRRLTFGQACLAYKLGVPATVLLDLRNQKPMRMQR